MERNYLELLTIGEIAKLTEINPKSIRYYERIGILKPAWVDPETGYRYYIPEQIHHLFAIKTCIHFGIPLRDFPKYYKNGTLYASRYLQDASANFMQSIRSMLSSLAFLENLQSSIGQTDRLIAQRCILNLDQPGRTFLIREISQDLTTHGLFQVFAELNLIAKQQLIQKEPYYGKIAIFQQGQLEHFYAAVEISRAVDAFPTLTLPAASYASFYTETQLSLRSPEIFSQQASSGQKMLVFESTCVASQYTAKSPGYILRCINL